jgi:hypothetical protein
MSTPIFIVLFVLFVSAAVLIIINLTGTRASITGTSTARTSLPYPSSTF